MVGNMKILGPSSDTWSKIERVLIDSNSIGTELPLTHPDQFQVSDTTLVYTSQRPLPVARIAPMNIVPRNQTVPPTTTALPCGHHPPPGSQSPATKCTVMVVEVLSCSHQRRTLCCEKGRATKCGSQVQKQLNCGHIATVVCHRKSNTVTCLSSVEKTFPCGHVATVPCAQRFCLQRMIKVLPCGHKMLMFCSGLQSFGDCPVIVNCELACGHTKALPCHLSEKAVCDIELNEPLPCGHVGKRLCSESMNTVLCDEVVQKQLDCGHKIPVVCSLANKSDFKCIFVTKHQYPSCGHWHHFRCLNGKVNIAPKCSSPVQLTLPCGHRKAAACHQAPSTIKCKQAVAIAHKVIYKTHFFSALTVNSWNFPSSDTNATNSTNWFAASKVSLTIWNWKNKIG